MNMKFVVIAALWLDSINVPLLAATTERGPALREKVYGQLPGAGTSRQR